MQISGQRLLKRLYVHCGRDELEYLLYVDLGIVAAVAGVAEYCPQRRALYQLFHEVFVYARLEAGRQGIAVHEEYLLAVDGFACDRQGQIHAPVEEHLEEQVFGGAVFLAVVDLVEQVFLGDGVGGVLDVFHIRGVDL